MGFPHLAESSLDDRTFFIVILRSFPLAKYFQVNCNGSYGTFTKPVRRSTFKNIRKSDLIYKLFLMLLLDSSTIEREEVCE